VTSPPQAFRTPRYNSLRVLPAFRARSHSLARFSPSSLATLLSLRDCELALDLKNYSSNSHSVDLPPASQYISELFNKPDRLVNDAVQVPMQPSYCNNDNCICTFFLAFLDEYYCASSHFTIPHPGGDYPLSNQYPSGPADIFATRFHAYVMWAPIPNAPSLL